MKVVYSVKVYAHQMRAMLHIRRVIRKRLGLLSRVCHTQEQDIMWVVQGKGHGESTTVGIHLSGIFSVQRY